MATAIKRLSLNTPVMSWRDDRTFSVSEEWLVTGFTTKFYDEWDEDYNLDWKLEAINAAVDAASATVSTITDTASPIKILNHGDTFDSLRLVQADAYRDKNDDTAIVRLQWAINDTPEIDGDWVYESWSEQLRVPRGIDVDGVPIKISYLNSAMYAGSDASTFIGKWYNKRIWDRGATVNGFDFRVHVVGRRHVSIDAAANMMFYQSGSKCPPPKWSVTYTNHVNANADVQIQGTWVCPVIRQYTRNRGQSFIIECEMVYNKMGHEEFLWFRDDMNLIPSDITIPAEMLYPWPTTRTTRSTNGGIERPQTLLEPLDFIQEPLKFDLSEVS